MTEQTASDSLRPFLADTKTARQLLGGMGHNKFWTDVAPRLKSIGSSRKRYWLMSSIEAFVEAEASHGEGH